jgi:hypothetical protein
MLYKIDTPVNKPIHLPITPSLNTCGVLGINGVASARKGKDQKPPLV